MKKTLIFLLAISAVFGVCSAHQPRLVRQQSNSEVNPVIVTKPEVSQAFYGILSGHADYYQIKMDTGFSLFVSLVVPDLPAGRHGLSGQRTDFVVDIAGANKAVYTRLDGRKFQRTGFYEEFAGDQYLQGPEYKRQVSAGTYTIVVSNQDNQGKYSLAIGQLESFPLGESLKTLYRLPALKIHFFDKSFFAIRQGKIIQFLSYGILTIIVLILIIVGSVKCYHRRHQAPKAISHKKK